jgi:hypothetical protein
LLTGESREAAGADEAGEQPLIRTGNTKAYWKDTSRMQQNCLEREEQADHAADNPALSHVVERNIRTIIRLRLQAVRAQSVQDRLADVITSTPQDNGLADFEIVRATVTAIDTSIHHVKVKTSEGQRIVLDMPPASLMDMQVGDPLTFVLPTAQP